VKPFHRSAIGFLSPASTGAIFAFACLCQFGAALFWLITSMTKRFGYLCSTSFDTHFYVISALAVWYGQRQKVYWEPRIGRNGKVLPEMYPQFNKKSLIMHVKIKSNSTHKEEAYEKKISEIQALYDHSSNGTYPFTLTWCRCCLSYFWQHKLFNRSTIAGTKLR